MKSTISKCAMVAGPSRPIQLFMGGRHHSKICSKFWNVIQRLVKPIESQDFFLFSARDTRKFARIGEPFPMQVPLIVALLNTETEDYFVIMNEVRCLLGMIFSCKCFVTFEIQAYYQSPTLVEVGLKTRLKCSDKNWLL